MPVFMRGVPFMKACRTRVWIRVARCCGERISGFSGLLSLYASERPYTGDDFCLAGQDGGKRVRGRKAVLRFRFVYGQLLVWGSNYEACIVTARNALLDYPYASPERREEFSIMILRAKYQLAQQSVEEKRLERYRDTIDEYYGFMNEYPESKYLKDAQRIFAQSEKYVNKKS